MRTLSHFGVPTTVKQENEGYLTPLKLYVTDYSKSPNRIEFLRFEPDSCMDPLIQNTAHIAYEVPCLKSALEGKHVIFEPMDCGGGLTIAFIEEEGIAIELMQIDR